MRDQLFWIPQEVFIGALTRTDFKFTGTLLYGDSNSSNLTNTHLECHEIFSNCYWEIWCASPLVL